MSGGWATALAAATAALAAAMTCGPLPDRHPPRAPAPGPAGAPAPVSRRIPGLGTPLLLAGMALGGLGLMLVLAPAAAGGAVVAVLVGVVVLLRRRRWRAVRAEAQRRAAVMELCSALVAELRAGRPPQAALPLAAAEVGLGEALAPALAALRTGADVAAALRAGADQSGAEGLRRLAACWHVAADTGAGLAVSVERVAVGLRTEEAVRREITAQLAGPRSSARLLAGLPVLALLLGAGLGSRPLEVLLGTPWGFAALVAGLLLSGLGLLWTDWLARAAEARV